MNVARHNVTMDRDRKIPPNSNSNNNYTFSQIDDDGE